LRLPTFALDQALGRRDIILRGGLSRKEACAAYLLLLIPFSLYIVFVVIPAFYSGYLSFTRYSGFDKPTWVGLRNYRFLLKEPLSLKSLFNTVYFASGTVLLSVVLSLVFAVLLNQPFKGRGLFRTIIYLPVVTPMLAVAFAWKFMLDPSPSGLVNYLFSMVGIESKQWLSNVKLAMPAVIFVSVWKTLGYNMIIYLAGLQEIPISLYEAAEIDGATFWQKFFYITVPLLKPVTIFVLVTSTISAFQAFEQIYGMTEGGPANSTYTLAYLIYVKAFRSLKFGEASALAVMLALIVLGLMSFYIKASFKKD
jgi:ABC-type sugar transport system permease subunit